MSYNTKTKELIDFAAEQLECNKRDLGTVLLSATKRRSLKKRITEALNRGSSLWYRLDEGYIKNLNNKNLTVTPDRPFIGLRPRVSHRQFAFQILRIKRTQGSALGPMLLAGEFFYPLGGIFFDHYRDEFDDFGDFFAGFMKEKEEKAGNGIESAGGRGANDSSGLINRNVSGMGKRIEILSQNLGLIITEKDGGLKLNYESKLGSQNEEGKAVIKVKGRGTIKGSIFLLVLYLWGSMLMSSGGWAMGPEKERPVCESDENSEFDFSEEMQQWQRELVGDVVGNVVANNTQNSERTCQSELEAGPSTSTAHSTPAGQQIICLNTQNSGSERGFDGTVIGVGTVAHKENGTVDQRVGLGKIRSENDSETANRVQKSHTDLQPKAKAQTGLVQNGFQLDALKWAQVHQLIPPPSVLCSNPQILRTAVVVPFNQQGCSSSSVSGVQLMPTNGEMIVTPCQPQQNQNQQPQHQSQPQHQIQQQQQHQNQQQHQQMRPNYQRQRAIEGESRFTPRRLGPNRSHPYGSRTTASHPFIREQRETQQLPINWPWNPLPQIQIPAEVRRVLLRRLAQEREHAFGLAGVVRQWNPPMALLLLSMEAFYSTLLAFVVNEGEPGPSRPQL
ncbi:hypothetical protein niasHT_000765 [Heterodera trifolii]|uniref:Uncharacterized protein n=1 Tax=Heterodera trifolii TaxID=157864 RepID=A0ABD2LN74_9BILA